MLATAIIVFREMLEAALIIGIVAAATRGVAQRNAWIVGGIAAGLLGAITVALLADVIMNLANGVGQEIFNASILLAAVVMLGWHNIWMARHSRELVAQMKQVGTAVKGGGKPMYALGIVVAVAVLREGSEVVLFLYGQAAGGLGLSMIASGGVVGLIIGGAVGFALYFGLLRIPTHYLFRVTGWMILLLAAGMASQAAKFLSQADLLPSWGRAWDSSALLADDSMTGRLLHTLMGYDANPLGIQLTVYLITLLTIGGAMKVVQYRDTKQKDTKQKLPVSNTAMTAALSATLLAALLAAGSNKTWADAADYIYEPNVEYGETEVELNGGYLHDSQSSLNRTQQMAVGVGRGFTPWWGSEVELKWDKDPSASDQYSMAEWVNIFQLNERGQNWMDLSLFTEFEFENHSINGANTFEIGPMFQKELGSTVNNLNLVWVNEYGSAADKHATLEYAWQTRVKGDPMLEFGFQAMGALGYWNDTASYNNQEHKIGPALFGEVKSGSDKVKYNGALLFGTTSNSPGATLRFTVEYEMH
jgi:high-affinity iron transporter